jgi:hypothetical protein
VSSPILYASDEIVVAAWLATLPGITTAMVGAVLPTGDATWTSTGFITVTTSGGTPSVDNPFWHPVVTCTACAKEASSDLPLWNMAFGLAGVIRRATYDKAGTHTQLAIGSINGATYPDVQLKGVKQVLQERRVYGDVGDVAQVRLDLQLDWTDAA